MSETEKMSRRKNIIEKDAHIKIRAKEKRNGATIFAQRFISATFSEFKVLIYVSTSLTKKKIKNIM